MLENKNLPEPGFQAKFYAPYFSQAPAELVQHWIDRTTAARQKTYRALRRAIKTKADFDKKIGQPVISELAKTIRPDYVTKDGYSYEDILARAQWKMKYKAAKKYFQKTKYAFQPKHFADDIRIGADKFAGKWCGFIGPLRGYQKSRRKGLVYLGVMALVAHPELKSFLKNEDSIKGQIHCIVAPEKVKEFQKNLTQLLYREGYEIINQDYRAERLARANAALNQLVEKYRLPEFAPFQPGGQSHLDFGLEEIPEPTPDNPNKIRQQLYLDIRVHYV